MPNLPHLKNSIINSKIIQDIGYDLTNNNHKKTVNTGKGTIEADVIQVKSLEIFGFVKENALILAYKFSQKINMYDGFIGLTFLRNHHICLDFNTGIGTFEE